MNRSLLLGPLLIAALAVAPCLAETTLGLDLYGEGGEARQGSLFQVPDPYRQFPLGTAVEELSLRHTSDGLVFDGALLNRVQEGQLPFTRGRLNELYADFEAGGLDWTVGKKVVSSGIGFGFRPLDVIQREDRRLLFRGHLEGVPMVAVERYGESSALSLFYLNRFGLSGSDSGRAPHELVVRVYSLVEGWELHGLLHLHERQGAAPGAGFTWVSGESLELHGAALYLPRYTKQVQGLVGSSNLLALSDTFIEREYREGSKALLGFTWTGASGWSLLGEAWHDSTAYTSAEWQGLFDLASAQRGLLGMAPDAAVYGNLNLDLTAFAHPSLTQNNLLLRLSYDGEKADPWLDLLAASDDGSWVATVGVERELPAGWRVSGGGRLFGGGAGSVYGEVPERGLLFLELAGEVAL